MASGSRILRSESLALADVAAQGFYFSPPAEAFSILLVFLDANGDPVDGSTGTRGLTLKCPDSTGRFVPATVGSDPSFPGDSWTAVTMLGAVQAVSLESTRGSDPPGATQYRYELLVPESNR